MTRLIVITGFLIAFGAGLMIGHVIGRGQTNGATGSITAPTTQQASGRRNSPGWMVEQLGLTDEQKIKLEEIWSETAPRGREQPRLISEAYVSRDKAIENLIHIEDWAAYNQILKQCDSDIKKIESKWRSDFQAAVERTKEILTPEQRKIYERTIEQFDRGESNRGNRNRNGGGPNKNGPPHDKSDSSDLPNKVK